MTFTKVCSSAGFFSFSCLFVFLIEQSDYNFIIKILWMAFIRVSQEFKFFCFGKFAVSWCSNKVKLMYLHLLFHYWVSHFVTNTIIWSVIGLKSYNSENRARTGWSNFLNFTQLCPTFSSYHGLLCRSLKVSKFLITGLFVIKTLNI